MRAIGAAKSQLFLLILSEGIILTFLGAIGGLILGHFFLLLIVITNEQGLVAGLNAITFTDKEWWVIVYALMVGVLASIIPAWNAYKEDIAGQLSK